RSCSWDELRYLCRQLEVNRTGVVVAATNGSHPEGLENSFGLASLLSSSLNSFPFSVRALNCFERANIQTVGDLVAHSPEKLLRLKNFGRKTLAEAHAFAAELSLQLGVRPEEIDSPQVRSAFVGPVLRVIDIRLLFTLENLGCRTFEPHFKD